MDGGGLLSSISTHLEKTPCFTFIKLENRKIKEIKVIESTSKPTEDSKTFTDFILDLDVDVVICGCLSENYRFALYENEVEVFSGEFGKVRDIIKEFKVGFLPITGKNFCKNNCKEFKEELNESSYNINRT